MLAQQAFVVVQILLGHAAGAIDALPAGRHMRQCGCRVPTLRAVGGIGCGSVVDANDTFRLGLQQSGRQQGIHRRTTIACIQRIALQPILRTQSAQ